MCSTWRARLNRGTQELELTRSKYQFSRVKCFCKTAGGTTFEAAKAQQRQEIISDEPILAALGRKVAAEMTGLATCERSGYRDVGIRRRKIALILGYLVLKHKMIAPGIPCEFGGHAMILMPIMQPMCEDDIRIDFRLQILEKTFHIGVLCRQETIPEVSNDNLA